MSLYNCKSDGDQYRISKFSNDLDVEASYLTDGAECDCPAGHRPVCRHRIMLSRFIAKNATAGQWFHNYEHEQWIRALSDETTIGDLESDLASAASEVTSPDDNYGKGPMMEAVYDLRADQAKDISPKPINLLELAKPRYEVPEVKFTEDFSGCAKNEIIDEMLPKPLRRL